MDDEIEEDDFEDDLEDDFFDEDEWDQIHTARQKPVTGAKVVQLINVLKKGGVAGRYPASARNCGPYHFWQNVHSSRMCSTVHV